MSTDEQYKPIAMREKYVSSDRDDIKWVLAKVLQYSKENFQTMYLIQHGGFYWMTDYPPEFKKRIATVYPGGRILYRGKTVEDMERWD